MKEKLIEKLRLAISTYFSTDDAIDKIMIMCKIDAYLELISLSELPKDLAKKVIFYNVSLMRITT